ncbi:site-specific integrase [Enterovibrio calviensis]|uniref:hypothetical protein n=1 Tax=Enterovibrio calviensis TaxID=91359 RepID=UPI001FE216DF|nr:hypothetical protein [Enterovibrio calviensis]
MTMLWGKRLSELRLARREHFDLVNDVWTVPPELSKMGNTIRMPIPKDIKPMLERLMHIYDDYLFPGTSLNKPIIISTVCSELGTMPHVTKKMLGHELGGIMAVYNKHDWLKEQKEAYEVYSDALSKQVRKELEHEVDKAS